MSLTFIISIITGLANTLLTTLAGQGVLSTNLSKLISTLLASAATLFAAFTSGGTKSSELAAVLAAIQNDLAALKSDTSLNPSVIAQLQESERLLQAAVTAYQAAQVKTDPSTLTPLPVN